MARPRKHTPEKEAELADQIEKLAAIHCQWEEIAIVLGEPADYLRKRFSAVYAKGKESGKITLKRKMFQVATQKDNVTMMIWLSKQMLGYSEKIDQNNNNTHLINQVKELTELPKEKLLQIIEAEAKKIEE